MKMMERIMIASALIVISVGCAGGPAKHGVARGAENSGCPAMAGAAKATRISPGPCQSDQRGADPGNR